MITILNIVLILVVIILCVVLDSFLDYQTKKTYEYIDQCFAEMESVIKSFNRCRKIDKSMLKNKIRILDKEIKDIKQYNHKEKVKKIIRRIKNERK